MTTEPVLDLQAASGKLSAPSEARDAMDDPSSSAPTKRLAPCAICASSSAIYTCPRCSRPTCSLDCSRSHKDRFSCSGKRDRTAFVPMGKFGWATLMEDYGYLEQVGREVVSAKRDREKEMQKRFKEERGGKGKGKGQGKARELVRRAASQGVDLVVMPVGMARRTKNKTAWHPKEGQMHWTLELLFPHPPPPPTDGPSPSKIPSHLIPSAGATSSTMLNILNQTINSNKAQIPKRILSVLRPPPSPSASTPSTPSTGPEVVLALAVDPLAPLPSAAPRPMHVLPASATLEAALRGTKVLEWPRIEVWPREAWETEVVLRRIVEVPRRPTQSTDAAPRGGGTKRGRDDDHEEAQMAKRPAVKATTAAPGSGPLVGYGSSSDEDEGEDEDEEVASTLLPHPLVASITALDDVEAGDLEGSDSESSEEGELAGEGEAVATGADEADPVSRRV